MVSRRRVLGLCGGLVGAAALGWRPWAEGDGLAGDRAAGLARSAAALALAARPAEPWLETRPVALAHAAMALEAAGEGGLAAEVLAAGWRIAGAARTFGVSRLMAKLAWAAAYLGDPALSRHLLARARHLAGRSGNAFEPVMVERQAARIRGRDFAYRIDADRALRGEPVFLLGRIEAHLAAGDRTGALALAMARSADWDVTENAVAQAQLARIIARPRELVVT